MAGDADVQPRSVAVAVNELSGRRCRVLAAYATDDQPNRVVGVAELPEGCARIARYELVVVKQRLCLAGEGHNDVYAPAATDAELAFVAISFGELASLAGAVGVNADLLGE